MLPDGEFGKLVFTSLPKGSAADHPLSESARPHALVACKARTMRRMEKITGRSDDMMIVRSVNVFPTQIEELLLKRPVFAPHYQIVLTKGRTVRSMC